MAALPPIFTVRDALALCGVDDNALFGGETAAQRMAEGLFANTFMGCMDKSMTELKDDFDTFSALTAAQGQIRLTPTTKKKIKAFIQWTRDQIRMGLDPSTVPFPEHETPMLERRLHTHELFKKQSDTSKLDPIKPTILKGDVKWIEWKPTLVNYLNRIPGRDGVPLSYIVRQNDLPDFTPRTNFLDLYVYNAPHQGDAFHIDNAQVATIIQGLIVGNTQAETKIQTIPNLQDGRTMFQALDEYYLGVGVFANQTTMAEKIIASVYYTGEKKPHMWWDHFEQKLTSAYAIIDRNEQRQVYSNSQKLRALVGKIQADFLAPQLAAIQTELAKQPMVYTFENALAAIRNVVNQKYPPTMSTSGALIRTTRNVRAAHTQSPGGRNYLTRQHHNRNQAHHGGNGRGGRGQSRNSGGNNAAARGITADFARRNEVRQTRPDSEIVRLNNGRWIEYHPSFLFGSAVLNEFPAELRAKMDNQRAEYRRTRQNGGRNSSQYPTTNTTRQIQELQTQIESLRSQLPVLPTPEVHYDSISRVSQITQGTHGHTIMGGRNEQAINRQHAASGTAPRYDPNTGQRINKVISQVRQVSSATTLEPLNQAPALTIGDNETDNNADTTVMGQNFALLSLTHRIADVYSFDTSLPPSAIPIGTGATAYDHPDGYTILLIINEALWYGSRLPHSLWNPNQLRSFGIPYWDNPFDPSHELSIELNHEMNIRLQTKGTKVYFTSRVPTSAELSDPNISRIELTSDRDWNPTQIRLSQLNASLSTMDSSVPWKFPIRAQHDHDASQYVYLDPTSDEAILDSIDPVFTNLQLGMKIGEVATSDYSMTDRPVRKTFHSTERHSHATAEALSERFGIGIIRARKTLAATTQRGTRSAILPLERRYHADRRFGLRRLNGKFSTDTAYFPCRSLRGNIASQIYYDKCGFAACYHIDKADNKRIGPTLSSFASDYGIPEHLTMDGAQVQVGRHTEFQSFIRRHEVKFHVSHPRRPNENPAEGGIREIKRRFYRLMHKYDIPLRLWDFVLTYTIDIMNVTVNGSKYSKSRTPLEILTGITPDISEFLDFNIYDWVYYKTNAGLGPRELGRWLGVSHRRGPLMTYWILTNQCQIISCDSVQRVTNAERDSDGVRAAMETYTQSISPRLNAAAGIIQLQAPGDLVFDIQTEDEEFLSAFNRVVDDPLLSHAHDDLATTDPTLLSPDPFINMEIGIRRDPETSPQRAIVKRRKLDDEGNPIGSAHPTGNPLLDHRQYEIEFGDGTITTLSANLLTENILAQVDENGHRQLLLDEIIDHRTTADAISADHGTITNAHGITRPIRTTRGWDLLVQWKDGSTTWITLKDLKESFPVELARYARDHNLISQPVFAWWVPHVLRKSQTILSKVKSKYWERTHKYGIRIPKSVADAKRIDAANGNSFWMDAIRQEMSAIRVAVERFDGDPATLIGYQQITGHLVFDVKLGENFRRKARFCADGHKTETPPSITYSSVVSRDSVRIMLLIAALNQLSLKAADIQNAFLTAPNLEKVYIRAGPEFGHEEGQIFIIRRALYGLKSASAAFHAYLADKLDEIGFRSSLADPDVWLRPATAPDGTQYYSYVLAYVDDLLAIDLNPDAIMHQIGERFTFKNNEIKAPTNYLGARLQHRSLDGVPMWSMSSDTYIDAALKNISNQLEGTNWKLPSKVNTPLPSDYHPELDDTPELSSKDRTLFQELIGIVRWATEIGRVDVLHEVSLLSQYQACPREGHLHHLLRIFAYWKSSPRISLYFDPRIPNIDYTGFISKRSDFQAHYRDAQEALPHNMPLPRGQPVQITAFVDASHASNQKTRRSHTGFIVFINRAPILWYSKRQNTVEASTFSSEFLALKTCTEAITHLRYKLRMFGVPLCHSPASDAHPQGIVEPAHIFCDNASVVKNSTLIESTLHKKHSSLAYHFVRWHVAAGVISVSWIDSQHNLADTYTKLLPKTTRDRLFGSWAY